MSDTVFFKHKYITQPTLSSANILKKAINDLTHALKGRRNTNGIKEIEALQKLDELLNKAPEAPTPRMASQSNILTPRVASQSNVPTPRVASQNGVSTPRVANQSNASAPKVEATAPSVKMKEIPPEQAKIRQLIPAATNNKARILQ